jgi:two-component system, OmpR family, response regulator
MAKVLIVEDDETMAALLERGLTDEGYDVVRVSNGVDALIAESQGGFAAAAIDVMLPEMNGFEICRHLRARGSTLPVLLVTARDAVEDRVFGLDSGADDYLTKPFAFVELSARIRALVRRDAAVPRPTIVVGNLSLDTHTDRARVNEVPLSLSAKEFSLLRILASNAGQAVTRVDILEEVWGSARYIDQTIVDQYVSYVRRKLEPLGAGISIVTVRGIGYSLNVTEESE